LKKKRNKSKKRKNQKANQQNPKKHKSKIKGEKRGKKGNTKMGKNGFVHLHFVCIFLFSRFAVFWLLLCFFLPGKKQKKQTKIEKAKYMPKNANGQIHVFPIVSHFSPFFPHFFPFLTFLFFPIHFASFFFSFEVSFLIFHVSSFFAFFQV